MAQQVLPDYSGVQQWFGTDTEHKDNLARSVGSQFDYAIMKMANPIVNMINPDGSTNKNAINNLRPPMSTEAMWDSVASKMPSGRSIDIEQFMQKNTLARQQHDMKLAGAVDQLRGQGKSDKQIRKLFKDNPEELQYIYKAGIMAPPTTGINELGWGLGVGGAVYGGSQVAGLMKTPTATIAQKDALKKLGYNWSKTKGITRASKATIAKGLTKEQWQNYLPKKKAKVKGTAIPGSVGERNRKIAERMAQRLNKEGKTTAKGKAASEIIKARKAQDLSLMGKKALEKGIKGPGGKVATNVALKNLGMAFAGKGAASLLGRAAGTMLGGPLGWAITAGTTLPWLWNLLTEKE